MDGYVDDLARRARSELELITAGRKAHLSPGQWKPVAYVAWAPEAGVTLDGGPLLRCFERNVDYLNEWFEKTANWQKNPGMAVATSGLISILPMRFVRGKPPF